MPDHSQAEAVLTELRATVQSLESDVAALSAPDAPDVSLRARTVSELITQALLRVDSVTISKDAAATALRDGDRHTSRKLSVLLARRKTVVKKLNDLGDTVDALLSTNSKSPPPSHNENDTVSSDDHVIDENLSDKDDNLAENK